MMSEKSWMLYKENENFKNNTIEILVKQEIIDMTKFFKEPVEKRQERRKRL